MASPLFGSESLGRKVSELFRRREKLMTDRQKVLDQIIRPWDEVADPSGALIETHSLVRRLIQQFNLPSIQKYTHEFDKRPQRQYWVLCGHGSSAEVEAQISQFGGILGTPEIETLYSTDYLINFLSGEQPVAPGRIISIYVAPYYAVSGYAPNISLSDFNPSLKPKDLPSFYLEKAARKNGPESLDRLFQETYILPKDWRIARIEL